MNRQIVFEKLMQGRPLNTAGLIRSEPRAMADAWQTSWIDDQIANGVDAVDLPDIFGNFVVDGRRLGNNGRALAASRDTFSPYATRAFFDAALSLKQSQRSTEPLHYGLVRFLAPKLHSVELAKDSWYSQNALLHHVGQAIEKKGRRWFRAAKRQAGVPAISKPRMSYDDSTFHRVSWFESQRTKIRTMSLDSTSSTLWDFVDKDAFERITSDKVALAERSRDLKLLFHIATLLYYETDPVRHASSPIDDSSTRGQRLESSGA